MQSPTRIANSADLPPGGHQSIRLHGRDLVLYRTSRGRLRLVDAHCPHMGAHLGRGGRVDGAHMVCPFHGWKLDGQTGAVVNVPYSSRKPPRGACVRTWPVREGGGTILADVPASQQTPTRHSPLPPFPRGWYALGFSRDVSPGTSHTRTWLGRSLRLRRDAPHGPVHVTAEDAGPRVATVEQQATLFGWFDPSGAGPTFELPALDPKGWSRHATHQFDNLATHPQETSENSVDLAHFTTVHGYDRVDTVVPAHADGPILSATYAFTRHILPGGLSGRTLRAEFRVRAFGLGYSLVETSVTPLKLRIRQLVLATPTVAGRLDLRLALSLQDYGPAPLRALAVRLTRWGLMRMYVKDVSADLDIWQHKRYLDPPRLAQGDGPIGLYRRWARQFYVPAVSRVVA